MTIVSIVIVAIFGFGIGYMVALDYKQQIDDRFTEIEHNMQSFRKELSLAFDNYEELVEKVNDTLAAMHGSRADNE